MWCFRNGYIARGLMKIDASNEIHETVLEKAWKWPLVTLFEYLSLIFKTCFWKKSCNFFFLQMSFTKRIEYKKKILYIGMKKINLLSDFKNEILFEMNLCTILGVWILLQTTRHNSEFLKKYRKLVSWVFFCKIDVERWGQNCRRLNLLAV